MEDKATLKTTASEAREHLMQDRKSFETRMLFEPLLLD